MQSGWLILLFQGLVDGDSSTRLIVGVLVAVWLLALGALLIHIIRLSSPSSNDRVIDARRKKQSGAGSTSGFSNAPLPTTTNAPATTNGSTPMATTVVAAETATSPEWDPERGAWVSRHPEFGLLVLNEDTNRWLAS